MAMPEGPKRVPVGARRGASYGCPPACGRTGWRVSLESLHAENGHRCCAWCTEVEHVDVLYLNPEATHAELAETMAAFGVQVLEVRRATECEPNPWGEYDWPPHTVRYRAGRPITPVPR